MGDGVRKKRRICRKTCDKPHYPYELPEGWCWTKVGEISKSILYGVSESAKSKGEYKLLRITDIQNNAVDWNTVPYTDYDEHRANAYRISDGDILFARTGATVGKSYLVKGLQDKAIYASYLIRVQTFNEILPEYVKYFFESGFYWEQIQKDSVGIGQPNVNGTTLSQLALPIPPINEQHRIVNELGSWLNIIDAIDNGKTELQIAIKRTKSKILALAIHGKLVPQDPSDEPANELLKRINPKAEITCDNPQYGKLPNGWCETLLGNIGTWQSGATPSRLRKEYYGGSIPWLKTGDLNDGIVQSIPECITERALEETSVKLNPAGSILIAMYGATIGRIGILSKPATTNQACCACVDYLPEKKFLFYFLLANRENFIAMGGGGAQPNISKEKIIHTHIPLPPQQEQQRIVAKIEELFTQLDKIEASL